MTGFIRIAAAALALMLAGSGVAREWPGGGARAETVERSAPYRDGAGAVVGTVRVLEVADPWEGYAESAAPAEGNRYVGLTLAVSADAGTRFDFASRSVLAQDTEGRLLTPSYLTLPEGAPMPALDDVALGPGSTVIGLAGYLVPEDATIARLWFAPTWSQLLPFADLQGLADPAVGDLAPVKDAAGATAEVTVTAIEFPFTSFADGAAPSDGTTPMLVTLVFRNTGDQPFTINPNAIVLRDRTGNRYSAEQFSRSSASMQTPNLGSVSLAPGDRATGVVGFRLPAGAEPGALVFEPESNRFMVVGVIGPEDLVASASPVPDGISTEPQAPNLVPPAATMMPPVLATSTPDAVATVLPPAPTAAPAQPAPAASPAAGEMRCTEAEPWLLGIQADLAWSATTLQDDRLIQYLEMPPFIKAYRATAAKYAIADAPAGGAIVNRSMSRYFAVTGRVLEDVYLAYKAADPDLILPALDELDSIRERTPLFQERIDASLAACRP
ncbi:MAG: DUF4352 domain-containing protein [Thermomicrobiales bacterium]